MSKQHVGVTYEEDECLITLFCECEDCGVPLAEFNNGCQCEGFLRRKEDFLGWNGITQEDATTLLNTLRRNK
jgi:hypothetical protein